MYVQSANWSGGLSEVTIASRICQQKIILRSATILKKHSTADLVKKKELNFVKKIKLYLWKEYKMLTAMIAWKLGRGE